MLTGHEKPANADAMTQNSQTPPPISIEEARERLESEFELNQSNVLPLDAASNEGRFYGSMIRGDRVLNPAQRIGFVLMGLLACGQALFVLLSAFPRLGQAIGMRAIAGGSQAVFLATLPFSALFFFQGVKFIIKAVTPNKPTHE